MPAVKRRLVNLTAALSLLLCVATVGWWARSYWRYDALNYADNPEYRFQIYAFRGLFGCSASWVTGPVSERWLSRHSASWWRDRSPVSIMSSRNDTWYGFSLNNTTYLMDLWDEKSQTRRVAVTVPCWLPALLLALPPGMWAVQSARRRRMRRQAGVFCLTCGYDLRATPDRCPECGKEVLATTRLSSSKSDGHR
jgi:hypothetical protein